jgi:hypothetical protein
MMHTDVSSPPALVPETAEPRRNETRIEGGVVRHERSHPPNRSASVGRHSGKVGAPSTSTH